MNEERFWELVSLQLSGEAQPGELAELEILLQEHPDLSFRKEVMTAIWQSKNSGQADRNKESFNKHLQRLSNHLSEPVLQYESGGLPDEEPYEEKVKPFRRYRKIVWAGGIAASLIAIVFLFSTLIADNKENKAHAQNAVSTKRGSKSKVQLPDGTQVWLNADSRITYNENFQDNQREVELTGEAFFDVVRDEKRPFIIHTFTIDVKVLGTAFNVRSYADETNTETSLIRGSVEITLIKSPDKKKIILKPNDKLIVNNNDATVVEPAGKQKPNAPVMMLGKIKYQEEDSSAVEMLWIKNKLVFDAEAMEDVVLRIERWYDVKVTIADEELKKVKFSATFEDEDLKTVMEALRLAGIKSTINKKEVILRQ